MDRRPVVQLLRNNAGRLYICVTEYDDDGHGVRCALLSYQDKHVADSIMERQYADMLRLMGDNIRREWK